MSEKMKDELQKIFDAMFRAQMLRGGTRKMASLLDIRGVLEGDGYEFHTQEIIDYLSRMIGLKLVKFYETPNGGVRYYGATQFGMKRWAQRNVNQVAAGSE